MCARQPQFMMRPALDRGNLLATTCHHHGGHHVPRPAYPSRQRLAVAGLFEAARRKQCRRVGLGEACVPLGAGVRRVDAGIPDARHVGAGQLPTPLAAAFAQSAAGKSGAAGVAETAAAAARCWVWAHNCNPVQQ